MKYVVVGKYGTRKVYWNQLEKGWYKDEYLATVFDDENSADSASIQAELTLTTECVDDISIECRCL